jgi:hypothetical protein
MARLSGRVKHSNCHSRPTQALKSGFGGLFITVSRIFAGELHNTINLLGDNYWRMAVGAGGGNRTRVISLEG